LPKIRRPCSCSGIPRLHIPPTLHGSRNAAQRTTADLRFLIPDSRFPMIRQSPDPRQPAQRNDITRRRDCNALGGALADLQMRRLIFMPLLLHRLSHHFITRHHPHFGTALHFLASISRCVSVHLRHFHTLVWFMQELGHVCTVPFSCINFLSSWESGRW